MAMPHPIPTAAECRRAPPEPRPRRCGPPHRRRRGRAGLKAAWNMTAHPVPIPSAAERGIRRRTELRLRLSDSVGYGYRVGGLCGGLRAALMARREPASGTPLPLGHNSRGRPWAAPACSPNVGGCLSPRLSWCGAGCRPYCTTALPSGPMATPEIGAISSL